MAIIEHVSFPGTGLFRGFRHFAQALGTRIAENRAYRRTHVALESLSDKELDDLGILRSDIPMVARMATEPRDRW